MADLQRLAERRDEDPELVPEILPAQARLAIGMLTKDLARLAAQAAAVVPSKEIIPGTGLALLEATDATANTSGYVRLSASDGEHWIAVVIDRPVKIIRPGSALVPAKKLLDVLKLAPHKATKLIVDGSTVLIRSGRAQWKLETPLGESLAATPQEMTAPTSEVNARGLAEALKAVSPAISANAARGALMQIDLAHGLLTASDGIRLHRARVPGLDEQLTGDIPGRVVPALRELLDGASADEVATVSIDERRILFQVGADQIIAQRMYDAFPDMETLILAPTISNDRALVVGRSEMLTAIKHVRIMSDPDRPSITLTTSRSGEGWALTVSSHDKFGNAAQETINAQWSGTKASSVTVHHVHLSDVVAAVSEDLITIRVAAEQKTSRGPILIADTEFTGVVAQMRSPS